MNNRIKVETNNRKEAKAIERALQEKDVKAFVLMIGFLIDFPRQTQKRIMRFVIDKSTEEMEKEKQ